MYFDDSDIDDSDMLSGIDSCDDDDDVFERTSLREDGCGGGGGIGWVVLGEVGLICGGVATAADGVEQLRALIFESDGDGEKPAWSVAHKIGVGFRGVSEVIGGGLAAVGGMALTVATLGLCSGGGRDD